MASFSYRSIAIASIYFAHTCTAFTAPLNKAFTRPSSTFYTPTSSTTLHATHTLVLIRHGESTWNKENRFTGWVDVPLSPQGLAEAKQGGELLRDSGLTFDVAHTSTLKRAIKTLWTVLEEMDLMYLPIKHTWRLNERHYGGLQGLNKQETVDKHGKEQVLVWRRSYDIPPPPMSEDDQGGLSNDPRYSDVDPSLLPSAESLKLTEERFSVEWDNVIAPEIKAGKRLLIAAHGNTLRALVKKIGRNFLGRHYRTQHSHRRPSHLRIGRRP